MMLKLAQKNIILNVFLVVFTSAAITGVLYREGTELLVSQALDTLLNKVKKEQITLSSHVDSIIADARFLAGTPPIQGIFRAQRDGGYDKTGLSTEQQWKDRLTTIFSTMLGAKQNYFQIRFIHANGLELVRVERKEGTVRTVPEINLQNKSGSEYVEITKTLKAGEYYVSDIELNRENGKIAKPYVPVLRSAVPVYDKKNNLLGMLVINLDIGIELERIVKLFDQSDQSLYITNDIGGYITHPDVNKQFGFELGHRYRIQEDYPLLASMYLVGNKEAGRTLIPKNSEDDALVSIKLFFDQYRPGHFIVLALARPYSTIVAAQYTLLKDAGAVVLLLATMFVVLGVIFSRMTSRPLSNITNVISSFRIGSSEIKLPVERHDEIGLLARAFNETFERVNQSQAELKLAIENQDKTIASRTFELQQLETRQRAILGSMADAVVTIDIKGTILHINPAVSKIFGFTNEELIGANVNILMQEKDKIAHNQSVERYLHSRESHIIGTVVELDARHADGSIFPVEISINAVNVNDEDLFIGVIRDITERHRMDQMKSEFISTVSHELRTPLTSIRGSLGLVTGGVTGELTDKTKEILAIASNNTERLMLLINDILDMQKIESGKLEFSFKSMPLRAFLEQAVIDNQMYADQYEVTFILKDCPDDISVNADSDRLMQVMSNLLSNAAKFSPMGDVVEISVTRQGNNIRISVADHGMGVPEDFREQLFDKFTQSDSSDTRQKGGTGLGLSISRLLVEKHGGTINYMDNENRGTIFYFEIPEFINDGTDNMNTPSLSSGQS